MACCNSNRENGFKLEDWQFRLGLRKKLFMRRGVEHWCRLPRKLLGPPSLETLKVRLNGALRNLIYLKMSMLMAGRLD